MEDRFSLLLSLKTHAGFEVYGQFGIGNDSSAASALFESLQGDEKLRGAAVLHIDLMETDGPLPVKIRTKCCRLDGLAANCKLITREVFRQKNLRTYEE
ncbi:hypothetical protein GCM10023149_21600 [Mucilaginibacter gynuensis]|uniref:Uncharacterized protein n=1 Tax=Mucilaginibacter gynuensis TaxID=1302236 RepID=A0ABP8GCB3_9SPHI